MVIINANINTCDHGRIIENGYIVIRDGMIAEIGEGIYRGDERELYDAAGRLVIPGFIDSHCHIGIWESGLDFEGDDTNEMTDHRSVPLMLSIRWIALSARRWNMVLLQFR